MEGPEIHPWIYSQLISDKGAKNTLQGKDGLFSTNGARKNRNPCAKN